MTLEDIRVVNNVFIRNEEGMLAERTGHSSSVGVPNARKIVFN
jgi:hypothetical protein